MRTKTTTLIAALALAAALVISATPGIEAHPGHDAHAKPISTETMGWVDENGDPIVCPDGQPLKVSEQEILHAPNVGESVEVGPSGDGVTSYEVTESMVPRCGPGGGGQDGTPIFVPEGVGAERTVAPKHYVKAQR